MCESSTSQFQESNLSVDGSNNSSRKGLPFEGMDDIFKYNCDDDKSFNLSIAKSAIPEYNSITDKHLKTYFRSKNLRKILQANKIINLQGEIIGNEQKKPNENRLDKLSPKATINYKTLKISFKNHKETRRLPPLTSEKHEIQNSSSINHSPYSNKLNISFPKSKRNPQRDKKLLHETKLKSISPRDSFFCENEKVSYAQNEKLKMDKPDLRYYIQKNYEMLEKASFAYEKNLDSKIKSQHKNLSKSIEYTSSIKKNDPFDKLFLFTRLEPWKTNSKT